MVLSYLVKLVVILLPLFIYHQVLRIYQKHDDPQQQSGSNCLCIGWRCADTGLNKFAGVLPPVVWLGIEHHHHTPKDILGTSSGHTVSVEQKKKNSILTSQQPKDPDVVWLSLNPSTPEQEKAYDLLKVIDAQGSKLGNEVANTQWNYESNITEHNRKIMVTTSIKASTWRVESWHQVMEWKGKFEHFPDKNLKRQFEKWSVLGNAVLEPDELKKMEEIQTHMKITYSNGTICDYWDAKSDFLDKEKCNLKLDPDLKIILAESKHYDELAHVWKEWRDATGKQMKEDYSSFVKLSNKVAKLNDYEDMGDMWRDRYEDDNFRKDINRLWDQLKPLYEQLHAYVRRKMREIYGEDRIGHRGLIPAHILGNMWTQTFVKKFDLLEPYPGKQSIDVTYEMKKQGYTAKKMFELSEDFFLSLNLTKMPKAFWDKSIIERPVGRDLVCHASAWDMNNHKDFRIKQCTKISMSDLITVHHEMGHIQYYLQYNHQPDIYRGGANAGFHEAVGDSIALSVSTPKHLHKIGLLKELVNDYEADINFLMKMALDKVAFLPFAFLMDNWRWDVFSGDVKEENWNCHWWKYRLDLQGIKPPVKRTESDFDPGAKFHIPANVPYIRYFVSFVLQFQFHKALCLKANEYDPKDPEKPLHQCDIYKSTEAGAALSEVLKQGMSIPWPESLKMLTGTERMDASVIREYFKPLEDWLKKDNAKHNEFIGWEIEDEYCS